MLNRKKFFYIAYDIHLSNEKIIHGSGTFTAKIPEIEAWIIQIKEHTENEGLIVNSIQIFSCIRVKKDFIS